MPFELLALPEEILLNVLLSLSTHREILRCSQTCKPMYTLVAASCAVQYRIQLVKYGMVEGHGALALPRSSDGRLKHLQDTITRRRTFQPTLVHDLGVVEMQYERAFNLLDGIYVRLTHGPFGVEDRFIARLSIRDISGTCCQPAETTTLDILPINISIFPSRDIVMLLTSGPDIGPESADGTAFQLHVRTLSSGGTEEHPQAPKPIFRFCIRNGHTGLSGKIHILVDNDIVAVYVRDYIVQLFRWTTGQHLVNWICASSGVRTISAFSLISPTRFAIGYSAPDAGLLAIYRIPDANGSDGIQVQTEDSHVELSLPRPRHDHRTVIKGLHTSPPRSSKGVFEAASRITVMEVTVEPVDTRHYADEEDHFVYVLRRDLFGAVCQDGAVTVHWNEWGPSNSRLIGLPLNPLPDNSVCSGSRVICRSLMNSAWWTPQAVEFNKTCPFFCFDFGDVHDSTFRDTAHNSGLPSGPLASDIIVCSDEDILQNIRTSLPYYVVVTEPSVFTWSHVLVDGDRMICSRAVSSSDGGARNGGRRIEHVYEL